MTRIAGSAYPAERPKSGFAVFSPNGKRFAIVLSKGNMKMNSNDYCLLVFQSADVFHGGNPKLLASFSSSSNRAGIFNIRWADDNETIYFLGARGDGATQLYSVRYKSGELRRLTNHPTSLISYGVSGKKGALALAAECSQNSIITRAVLGNGLHVQKQAITDLIRGRTSCDTEEELFFKRNGFIAEQRLHTTGQFSGHFNNPLHISPDGRYLLVKTETVGVPSYWGEYQDLNIQALFRRGFHRGSPTGILQYEIIDTQTGKSEALLDAPAPYSSADVLWSPDSKSVLLCGAYLPLGIEDLIERESRRSARFVVEVKLPSRRISRVASEELTPVRWDPETNIVEFRSGRDRGQSEEETHESVYYGKRGEAWERVPGVTKESGNVPLDVFALQDLQTPPRVIAVNRKTKQRATILNLNPQFSRMAFGKVEEVHWKDRTGNTVTGGLYLPPDYSPGRRYPLVIQTHGFDPDTFVIDGSHVTASAAQPLASNGIVVLQVEDIFSDSLDTAQEPERAMNAYETGIEYLDKRGIVDRDRVGIVGFSRTCLYVKYALTHSDYRFAAAVVADGVDAGYFQYLMFYNAYPMVASEFESIIGGPPFGAGLSLWLEKSPGFLLDRVQAPLQIQAIGPDSILNEWQWFEGLERLDKPVDFVYLPTGSHVLVKPRDRLVSQEGTLDWFCFWLQEKEDPNPAKAEKYLCWNKLRAQLTDSRLRK
jgi:dipeptidyl aminopeptidase/acylaminoacyl peptidase